MLEIPCDKILYTIHGRNCDVQSVSGPGFWYCLGIHQSIGQIVSRVSYNQAWNSDQFAKPLLGRIGIVSKALVNDELRYKQPMFC